MLELAPHHKYGLPVANPIMLAGGTIGYGEALMPGLETARLGAVVVGPFLRHSRAGTEPPRLGETNGGFVLETGFQNRGVNAAVRRFARLWPELGCPVIAQIADSQPRMAGAVAERLTEQPGLIGLEVLVAAHAAPQDAYDLIRNVARRGDLPVLAKLPLPAAATLAPAAVDAGAAGLVLGRTVAGAALSPQSNTPITGPLYGPLAFAAMLPALQQVIALDLGCSLVACGGIYTLEQAEQVLALGADALQLDAVVWTEPGLPALLADEIGRGLGEVD